MPHTALFEERPKAIKDPFVETLPLPNEDGKAEVSQAPKEWKPFTLKAPFLLAVLAVTCGLAVIIQWLLLQSHKSQGIIFASNINDLPLRRAFPYLYLPTLISVIYGFLWTWIDLDIKRLEPFYQLSRPGGATAEGSVLLHYPFDFAATLPYKASRSKHWAVFAVSIVMILVSWGLTPVQAGIFAVRSISMFNVVPMSYATRYTDTLAQGNLSVTYAQSVYNILWLNETLPPFMTRDVVLGAFGPHTADADTHDSLTYTGTTNLYSIDLLCEAPTVSSNSGVILSNSSNGCSFMTPPYRPIPNNDTTKTYDTIYVGYQNQDGFADWYLSDSCPATANHTFYIRWSRSSEAAIAFGSESISVEPGQANATALFCTPTYYQQKANATISLPDQAVLDVQPLGDKSALPNDLFNISTFEWAMSSGQEEFPSRDGYPQFGFPDQKTHLQNMPLNLAYIPKMAPFAIAAYQQPPENYLDAEALRLSYQAAYRLLFARQLVDILHRDLDTTGVPGQSSYTTQAVIVVPGFAYAAEVLLALIALMTLWLLVIGANRHTELQADPGTIGSLMDMVDGKSGMAAAFAQLDLCNSKDLQRALIDKRFMLISDKSMGCSSHVRLEIVTTPTRTPPSPSDTSAVSARLDRMPRELSMWVGLCFLGIQIAACVAFAGLFVKVKASNGLVLPSTSTLARQVVENYLPVALATLMEPFWMMLARLLCLLEPWEELHRGNALASRSVDLAYNSLPPQFIVFRALEARHWVLASACVTTVLANGLTVALSGLFYENVVDVALPTRFTSLFEPRFKVLNGTGLPFNTDTVGNWQGGTTLDQFYREMSNKTAGTLLPPWTDEQYAYVPVDLPGLNSSVTYNVRTHAFGAQLACQPLNTSGPSNYSIRFSDDASRADFKAVLNRNDGTAVHCTELPQAIGSPKSVLRDLKYPQSGHVALEIGFSLGNPANAVDDLFCRQHIVAGWMRSSWVLSRNRTDSEADLPDMQLASMNETMMLCHPTLQAGEAEIVVDATGRPLRLVSTNMSNSDLPKYFSSSAADLIAQVHQFLIDNGATWHTDASPSDFNNYLMMDKSNWTQILDASAPVPSYDKVAQLYQRLYSRLFAMLIGTNSNVLFVESDSTGSTTGTLMTPETRIFISLPAFVVSIVILGLYMLTTTLVYARRPGRFLPRLPTTLASIIAYFAASHALHGQRRDPRQSPHRWAYRRFVGVDNGLHVGIEPGPVLRVDQNM